MAAKRKRKKDSGTHSTEEESIQNVKTGEPKSTNAKLAGVYESFEEWRKEREQSWRIRGKPVSGLDTAVRSPTFGYWPTEYVVGKLESLAIKADKLVQEISDKYGERQYPEKNMYQVWCCIRRHLDEN